VTYRLTNKICGTQDSGYTSKKLMAECQTEYLSDPDSDCGCKRGIKLLLAASYANDYLYRYIMVNGKPVKLTHENINQYVGKVVELRSPMSCLKMKDGGICNKCAGDFYYMIGSRAVGLSASRIGNVLSNLNMKKFHDNTIKTSDIDIEDFFI